MLGVAKLAVVVLFAMSGTDDAKLDGAERKARIEVYLRKVQEAQSRLENQTRQFDVRKEEFYKRLRTLQEDAEKRAARKELHLTEQ